MKSEREIEHMRDESQVRLKWDIYKLGIRAWYVEYSHEIQGSVDVLEDQQMHSVHDPLLHQNDSQAVKSEREW